VLLIRLLLRRSPVVRTPMDAPILAFAVWTLLSASFSSDPAASHGSAKKLLLLGVFFLAVDTLADPRSRERVMSTALLGGIALAILMVVQYHALGFFGFNNRPSGFLGHYMSAAGLVMCACVVAAGRLAFGRESLRLGPADGLLLAVAAAAIALLATAHAAGLGPRATPLAVLALVLAGVLMAIGRGPWPGPATSGVLAAVMLPLGAWALLVSRTRNAWIGALAGVGLVMLLRAGKASLFALAGVVLLLVVARPAALVDRLTLTDASAVDRYYMWQAGIDMIRDKPVFGQGPGMILLKYPSYRWPEAPNPQAPHLHNNLLQLAAERGLPCALFWLWWMGSALAVAWRESQRLLRPDRREDAWVAVAALAAWFAVMVAGLFEYNFGDSEVLMFFLLVTALPSALRRQRALLPVSTA